jgi:hypothetical protein
VTIERVRAALADRYGIESELGAGGRAVVDRLTPDSDGRILNV